MSVKIEHLLKVFFVLQYTLRFYLVSLTLIFDSLILKGYILCFANHHLKSINKTEHKLNSTAQF